MSRDKSRPDVSEISAHGLQAWVTWQCTGDNHASNALVAKTEHYMRCCCCRYIQHHTCAARIAPPEAIDPDNAIGPLNHMQGTVSYRKRRDDAALALLTV
jgi:hypothetical protein